MAGSKGKSEFRLVCLIGLVLTLGTLACYWPTRHFDYVNYDDFLYVYQTPMVTRGLTWAGFLWAFRSIQGGSWNPLIWLSHMADCQVYGLPAGGHHVTNVLLHAANVCLLFFTLRRMTGATWRSALVAAIFAWHPLHVESVAWISERKDVLSTLFWLLTMWMYARYAQSPAGPRAGRRKYYALTLVCFVLGLLCKPMLVTLPLMLLLLDYWPLQRVEKLSRLLGEKITLFVLSLGACGLTLWSQTEAMAKQPAWRRLGNAAISYVTYLAELFCPVKLAPFYPYPHTISPWTAIGATIVLCAITGAVLAGMKHRRYLATGWLWFVVTLVPVIGFVQVGMQARADRYTYIPYIGLAIMVSWGLADLARTWPRGRAGLVAFAAASLAGCLAVTAIQVQYWENSTTLFEHAIKVTTDNYIAHDNLGNVLEEAGRLDDAVREFREVIRLTPVNGNSYNDLGKAYALQHRMDDAMLMFSNAVRLDPKLGQARRNLGHAHIEKGLVDVGLAEMEASVRLNPEDMEGLGKFADVLFMLGKGTDALPYCVAVARADPDDAHAQFALGAAYLAQKQTKAAAASFVEAVRLAPDNSKCLNALAWIYATSPEVEFRNGAEAVRLAERACNISKRQDGAELDTLAAALAEAGRFDEAIKTAREMLALAESSHDTASATTARQRLELYQAGKPYHREP